VDLAESIVAPATELVPTQNLDTGAESFLSTPLSESSEPLRHRTLEENLVGRESKSCHVLGSATNCILYPTDIVLRPEGMGLGSEKLLSLSVNPGAFSPMNALGPGKQKLSSMDAKESDSVPSVFTNGLDLWNERIHDNCSIDIPSQYLVSPNHSTLSAIPNGREYSPFISSSSSNESNTNPIQVRDFTYSSNSTHGGISLLATVALDNMAYQPVIDPNLDKVSLNINNNEKSAVPSGERIQAMEFYDALTTIIKRAGLLKETETDGTNKIEGKEEKASDKVQSPSSSVKPSSISTSDFAAIPPSSKVASENVTPPNDSFDVYFLHPSSAQEELHYSNSAYASPSSAYLVAPLNSKTSLFPTDEFSPSLIPSQPFISETDKSSRFESNMGENKVAENEDVSMLNFSAPSPVPTKGTIALFGLSRADGKTVITFEGLMLRSYSNRFGSKGLWPQLVRCAPFPSIAQYFRML
jgi:hypothetical protein